MTGDDRVGLVRTAPIVRYARTSDGVSIAYSIVGQGPAVVILPSVPFSNFVAEWDLPWPRAAYEALAQRMRLIQFDGRGTGQSQRDVADVSLAAMLRDVDAVIEQLGLRSASLLALYNACPIALAYAARRRDLVERLALFGGWARGWTAMSAPRTRALLSLIDKDWDLFSRTAVHEWLDWQAEASVQPAAEAIRGAVTPEMARSILQAFSGFDVRDKIPLVAAPTLVLHRREMTIIPLDVSHELAEALPAGQLVILEGRSATLYDRDSREVAELLAAFFVDGVAPASSERTDASQNAKGAVEALTPRERAVLRLIAGGLTNAEAAHRLSIAVSTVERHLGNIYRKLGLRGRAEAAAFAVRQGLD